MFRDREKALQKLQEQLLEEERDLPQEEPDEDDETVYADAAQDVRAYNTDSTDENLEDYSDTVYEASRRRGGCLLWFALLTAGVLLAISFLLAKQGGLL